MTKLSNIREYYIYDNKFSLLSNSSSKSYRKKNEIIRFNGI